ncbi:MAG: NADH-quinone oxidoreductase subunit NuoE [Thiohalocapsa sp.]|jgi:NADH-quinone oxidoreductase subunit E|uniref:NADH-quinone oxidoreductase subunit NuoE n=1 Tax=Thiohalocapsa sp. TaxID=2497641 RepID=UPI0025D246C5|nr:NADH-quinone oxidoreductase subunit NuoE [Thiohalocapsa sp.]MCG6943700.1 NADH-quinone oxidoreductase subunit NuoE [Thiohalocapsa sp.]
MLTEQEHEVLAQELERYPDRRAASIDCLVRLQESRGGWLSDETLADLAPVLDMSVHELDALATFYNRLNRRPVGRHLIRVCDSVSCWIMGSDAVCAVLRERLGIDLGCTTPDGRFTLLPTQCLGACERAPVLSIDDKQYTDLRADDLDAILADHD